MAARKSPRQDIGLAGARIDADIGWFRRHGPSAAQEGR
jgi:hypothetical protein